MISKEAFADWLENPATRHVMKVLKAQAEALKTGTQAMLWDNAVLSPEDQAAVNRAKGKVVMLEDIASWTVEDFSVVSEEKDQTGW